MTGAEPWIIGPMDEAHCGQAAALEVLCFSDPWGQESFRDFSASRLYRTFGAAPAEDGDLAGYAVLQEVAGEGELLRIAVDPTARGRGLGRKLLEAVTETAGEDGIQTIFLEVRQSNRAAVNLYRSAGFREIGRRRGYYHNPPEDAILMELHLV